MGVAEVAAVEEDAVEENETDEPAKKGKLI